MVKLAEKERESLEVKFYSENLSELALTFIMNFGVLLLYRLFHQGVKNEAEDYMLKELSLLKWQEKATKLASDKNLTEVAELQEIVSDLEANIKIERCFLSDTKQPWTDNQISDGICYF